MSAELPSDVAELVDLRPHDVVDDLYNAVS
jgi:hypothetical protein